MSFLSWGCSNTEYLKTELNEVYSIKNTSEGFVADNLLYRDSIVFQYDELAKFKYVFDKNTGEVVGLETYPDVTIETEIQSNYEDSEGNALSYYKHIIHSDDKKSKRRSEAYDASNDELLRYEEMEYDEKGRLNSRRIFTSSGQLASSYNFVYDQFDNEILKVTQHLLRDTMISEQSKITKYDKENNWTEKWGFIEDKPVAFYKRKVITH